MVKILHLILFGYQDSKNFLISIHIKKYYNIIVIFVIIFRMINIKLIYSLDEFDKQRYC